MKEEITNQIKSIQREREREKGLLAVVLDGAKFVLSGKRRHRFKICPGSFGHI